jgi:8-oxo-dGTP pyrophosphatase MutT (NUDIX family)
MRSVFNETLLMNKGTRSDYFHDPNAPEPNSMVPAAGGAVFDATNRILLVRRADNDKWALPGGKIELNESVLQAVEREIREETGLQVKVQSLIGVYSDPEHIIAYPNGEVRRQFFLLCRCDLSSGSLATDSESTAIGFFSKEETATLNLSPSQRQRIDDAFLVNSNAVVR